MTSRERLAEGCRARWWPLSTCVSGVALLLALGVATVACDIAQADEAVVRHGHFVPTDEVVKPKALPQVKSRRVAVARKTAQQDGDGLWLFDYISRLIDKEPEAAKRVRPASKVASAVRGPKAGAARVASLDAAVPVQPAAPVVPQPAVIAPVVPAKPIDTGVIAAPVAPPAPVMPAEPLIKPVPVAPPVPNNGTIEAARPVTEGREIVTGTIASLPNLRPTPPPAVVSQDASQALVQAAERAQARSDLVKLELANRAYDERRLSGQPVFDLRSDWRVLERARDALSGPELAAAQAAGFEANAYINEMTKTIVVAVAGSEDLKRDFLQADIWDALIRAQMPQHFFLAKTYIRSVMQRYQMQGFSTECVGHSLGGGACAYAAGELNVRAIVVNPIAAGKLPLGAKFLVTNYVVDGEIANIVYGARGIEFSGDVVKISDSSRDEARLRAVEKFGPLAGPILVVRNLSDSVKSHKIERALELIAVHAGMDRPR